MKLSHELVVMPPTQVTLAEKTQIAMQHLSHPVQQNGTKRYISRTLGKSGQLLDNEEDNRYPGHFFTDTPSLKRYKTIQSR